LAFFRLRFADTGFARARACWAIAASNERVGFDKTLELSGGAGPRNGGKVN
jgi:hypothetical protein